MGRHARSTDFRKDKHFLWSRGEELITDKFPELDFLAEILFNGAVRRRRTRHPYKDNVIGDFNALQNALAERTSHKNYKRYSYLDALYDLSDKIVSKRRVVRIFLAKRQELLTAFF